MMINITIKQRFVYDDGGREIAGYKGTARDCVCRAIAIATERPYKEIYNMINEYGKKERITKKRKERSTARNGVHKDTARKILNDLGWEWHPTMHIGSGCKVHLRKEELPKGKIICAVSKHYVAVIDGMVHDTYDCTSNGNRCVYGYYIKRK